MSSQDDISAWPDLLESQIEANREAHKASIFDRVMVVQETLSTQDSAARACHGLESDHKATFLVAGDQLMGRGQRAKNWFDAKGCTLPCSVAIGPETLGLDNAQLAARAGLAALDAVKCMCADQRVGIKWPNDIFAGLSPSSTAEIQCDTHALKKIAGVLIEHAKHSIVIGIGINCLQSSVDLEPSIRDTAISLKMIQAQTSRIDLACALIKSLEFWLGHATTDQVRVHWKEHDALVGTQVKCVYNNRPYVGSVIAVDPVEAITLQTTEGAVSLPVTQTRLVSV
ncbi:MAG: biotin--[acetyl-CoA-carboxylase] ligase [Phycisphaerales bacterium]